MPYGKIENGVIRYAPKLIEINGKTVFNPTEEMLVSEGYVPVITTEPPKQNEFCKYVSRFEQQENKIVQVWEQIAEDYGEAVDAEIRKRYSVSQEFALLRQKDEKPEEYAEYFAYCEECKRYIKSKLEAVL